MNLFALLNSDATSVAQSASSSASNVANQSAGNPWMTYVIYGVIILMFIFLFVSSSRKRKQQQAEMQEKMNSIAVGDKIKTIGMICGTVQEVCDDGTIVLLTGSETYPSYIKIDRQAIYQFSKPGEDGSQSEPFEELKEETADQAENQETAEKVEGEEVASETTEQVEGEQVASEKTESEDKPE